MTSLPVGEDIPDFLLVANRKRPMSDFKPRPLVWSYTLLSTFRNICPHQAFRRYIKKDIPYVETPQMKRGNDVHTAMELRGGGKPLPADMETYEPFARCLDGKNATFETKLGVTNSGHPCEFFGDSVWGRGKLDVTIINGENAYLADWKTGRVREDSFELEVQAVLLHAKNPGLKRIVGQYVWLKEGQLGRIHDVSDTRKTWAEINRIMRVIDECQTKDQFEKRPSGLCGWCNVMDCENNPQKQGYTLVK